MTAKILDNTPELWRASWPVPQDKAHKYDRGHLCIMGAPALTGATRLSAQAALYTGVGLISVLANTRADIYRMTLPADIMVTGAEINELNNVTACLAGPGGIDDTHVKSLSSKSDLARIIDSSAFKTPCPESFYNAQTILTPHSGEFSRLFPDISGTPSEKAREGAKHSQAIIVLKGPQTFIAHPDGRCACLDAPNPHLARAGTGDVLVGIIAGLVAQKMPPFEAACAGVWIHSTCAARAGYALIASELHLYLRDVINEILQTP